MRFNSKGYKYKKRATPDLSEKAFRVGDGRISGYISVILATLSLIAVLAYQFPSYLTTTELRSVYDAKALQFVLKYSMWVSMGFALLTFIS